MRRIIFWQNMPSIHQAPVIKELAAHFGIQVLVVAESELTQDRIAQGWHRPDFGRARLLIAPSRASRQGILRDSDQATVHVFSGIHAYPETYWTLRKAIGCGVRLGVFLEAVDDRGWRGALKRGLYRWHATRWSRDIEFMLLTGAGAFDWFSERGFAEETMFPFGYFVEQSVDRVCWDSPRCAISNEPFHILFIGQLLPRKGLDLLLRALAALKTSHWRLSVLGGGNATDYSELANALGLGSRVTWLGVQPNPEVLDFLVAGDVLVLPSRFDGWGAVVNEALAVGTPVLASEACGSAQLVGLESRGAVFKTDSVSALEDALRAAITRGRVDAERRKTISDWAARSISPRVAAGYLAKLIAHVDGDGPRPNAPWLNAPLGPRSVE